MKITTVFTAISAALMLSGCASALKPGVTPTTCCGLEACVISNGIVAATVVPDASGVCTDIRCGSQLFTPPLSYSAAEVDPLLPPYCSQNPTGGRSELWTQKIMTQIIPKDDTQPVALDDDGSCAFRMVKNYWKGRMLRMERTVSVHPGETRIIIDTQVTNTGKNEENVGLWDNFAGRIGSANVHDELLFPSKGNVSRVGNRGVEFFPNDMLYVKNVATDSRGIEIAPAESWIGRRLTGHTLFVLNVPDGLGKDGFLYSFCGAPDCHTSEPVHETVKLKPNENTSMRVEYMMFPGMDNLRGLCKNIAVDLQHNGRTLVIIIGAVCKTAPGTLTIDGIGTVDVPEITPGVPVRLTLPLNTPDAAKGLLKASFANAGSFTIFPR